MIAAAIISEIEANTMKTVALKNRPIKLSGTGRESAVRRRAMTAADIEDLYDLLRRAPVVEQAKQALIARMTSADRFYHDAFHLVLLWRRHREHAPAAGLDAPAVERSIACAIAYHDAVFDATRADNEERSALLWLSDSDSDSAAMSDEERRWVADTIRATRDHASRRPFPDDERIGSGSSVRLRRLARDWVLDLDLTPLGEPRQLFERNTRLLRREARLATDAEFEAGQKAFLSRFQQAEQIYHTPVLAAQFEAPARLNIARALAGA
jgi:predicted metal-dependent HD superfamily phosphohydrolase